MTDDRGASPDEVEFLDVGAPEPRRTATPSRPQRSRTRWLLIAAAVVIAGGVVAVVVHSRGDTPPPVAASSQATPSVGRASSPNRSASTPSSPAVSRTHLGHALLGVRGTWELFGRGVGVVVRLQFAHGDITRTRVPALDTSGPVSMVVGSDRVFIEPLDTVPGFVVLDGQPAALLPTPLANLSYLFPGPGPGQVWAPMQGSDPETLRLLDSTGRPVGPSVTLPAGGNPDQLISDGAGGLLITDIGGTYELRPSGLRRVTSGALIGIGPTRFVSLECDAVFHCTTTITDRSDGRRHILIDRALPYEDGPGLVSPDGRTAALVGLDPGNAAVLHLVDLTTFHDRTVNLFLDDQTIGSGGAFVWSPDSSWLFAVRPDGTIAAVDPRTGAVRSLDAALPGVVQLGVRAN